MRLNLVLLLLFVVYTLSKLGSLSLYHTAGTTFLNLRKTSQPCSITYEYKNKEGKIPLGLTEKLEAILKPKQIIQNQNSVFFSDTPLGNVTLFSNSLTTSYFNASNGHRYHQGWILDESDYYTQKEEDGDEEVLKNLIHALETFPVVQKAIRVNIQVPMNATLLRDLLINMWHPENRQHMLKENNFEAETPLTPGFINKILSNKDGVYTYRPTMDELYDDFLIRQTAEKLGLTGRKAFSYPIDEIRTFVLNSKHFKTRYVAKPTLYALDLTSILIKYRPEDEISQYLSKSISPSDSIQFRELRGLIDVAVRRAAGFVKVTQIYGTFIHDSLVSQVCYLEKSIIEKIRAKVLLDEAITFKYITWDPETCSHIARKRSSKVRALYKEDDVVLGYIAVNLYGIVPLFIPGESTVWHQRTEHRFNIMGKYNPALISYNVGHLLENKYFEGLYFNSYCKGIFPKTIHVKDILDLAPGENQVSIDDFLVAANKAFPQGWVVKGIWDYNGAGDVLSHLKNHHKMLNTFHASSFPQYAQKVEQLNFGCEPIEDLYAILRTGMHFQAWKLEKLLQNINDTMLQEFTPPWREYRVEVFAAEAKYQWMSDDDHDDSPANKKLYKSRTLRLFNECLAKIPERIRGIPLTSDVAFLKDKQNIKIFETNPGGNGYLYHHEFGLLRHHNRWLKEYRFSVASETNHLHDGLNPEEQMVYIHHLLKQWNVDIGRYERRFKFLRDRIVDVLYVHPKGVDLTKINSIKPQKYASARVSIGKRYKQIRRSLEYVVDHYSKLELNQQEFVLFLTSTSLLKEGLSSNINDIHKDIFTKFFKQNATLVSSVASQFEHVLIKVESEEAKVDLLQLLVRNVDLINAFRILNIPVGSLEDLLTKSIEIIKTIENIEKKLFPRFDVESWKLLESFVHKAKSSSVSDSEITKMSYLLDEFSDAIYSIRHLERSGYDLSVSLSKTVKKWLPILHTCYSLVDPKTSKIYEVQWKPFYLSLVNSVVHVLHALSDDSLYYLDKDLYKLEYDFVIHSLKPLEKFKDNDLLGNAVDIVMIFSGDDDPNILEMMNSARRSIISRQNSKGIWIIHNQVDMRATLAGIRGLVEHSYLTTNKAGYCENVAFEEYVDRLKLIGFMSNYKIQTVETPKIIKHDEL